MEIVPILSTIILVGTLATFILAVAAYVLYKVREGRVPVDQPSEIGEESYVGAPAEAATYMAPTGTTPPADFYVEHNHVENSANFPPVGALNEASGGSMPLSSFFWEYTNEGFLPVDANAPAPHASGDGSAPLDTDEEITDE